MAGFQGSSQRGLVRQISCFSVVLLLVLLGQALRLEPQEDSDERRTLASSEIPAEHIDPAAIDLTPLVNTLINSSQSGSRQLFSLLSVTSYSSLALHKLTLLVYNISSAGSVESSRFRRRFCYCVTNGTNDLTDFAAVLLDVMGNATSRLHELFKSSSILSVSQRNDSDCISICVMAGRAPPELWELGAITPLFNQTIIEGPHTVSQMIVDETPTITVSQLLGKPSTPQTGQTSAGNAVTTQREPAEKLTTTFQTIGTSQPVEAAMQPAATSRTQLSSVPTKPAISPTRPTTATLIRGTTHSTSLPPPSSPSPVSPPVAERTTKPLRTTTPSRAAETQRAGCPWRRSQRMDGGVLGSSTTVSALQLQPCVLELCKFFSQCLCRPSFGPATRLRRYCDDSQRWYQTHTSEVCRRVRRVSFSRNLKQRCLAKMCNNL
ncbi:HERV-H LTR-associating protein 1 [Aulostomus maculatus]